MNKEIELFAEKATTIEEHGWGGSYINFDKERFAEMIIRECADIASINQFSWEPCGDSILKYFGIERAMANECK